MNVDAMRERIKPRKRRFFLFLFFQKKKQGNLLNECRCNARMDQTPEEKVFLFTCFLFFSY
jgi:hypothetical protein